MAPKVSILIPTYNRPFYFKLALQSALAQTFSDVEVVISDDSDNEEIKQIVDSHLENYPSIIRYYKNPKRLGFADNFRRCLELAEGEYVNFLLDDDLFHPQKIEKMMVCFTEDPEVTMVTSNREYIDEDGQCIRNSVTGIFKEDLKMHGIDLGNIVLKECVNHIGEPTVVLFKREALKEPYGFYAGKQNRNNSDVAAWLGILKSGKAVFLADCLSYIRVHRHRVSESPDAALNKVSDWINNIFDSVSDNYLKNPTDLRISLQNLNKIILNNLFKVCESNIAPKKEGLNSFYSSIMAYLEYVRKTQIQGENLDLLKSMTDFYNHAVWKLKLRDLTSYLDSKLNGTSREICIWGAGSGGIEVLQTLRYNGVKVCGFIDSNHHIFNQRVQGLTVFSPDILLTKKEKPYVIIGSMFFGEIQKQIERYGFKYEIDYI